MSLLVSSPRPRVVVSSPRSSASLAVPLHRWSSRCRGSRGGLKNHVENGKGWKGKIPVGLAVGTSGLGSLRSAQLHPLQVCTTTDYLAHDFSTTSNRREMRVESVLPCDREVTLTVLRQGTVSEFPASRRGTVDDDDGDRAERRLL